MSAWGKLLRFFKYLGGQRKLLGFGLLGEGQYIGWHYEKEGTSKVVWTVFTCLILLMDLIIILIVLMDFACIRHS